jgi:hypothetical protein
MRTEKGQRMLTPIGRASFVKVFKAEAFDETKKDSPKKFSLMLLFDEKAQKTPAYKNLRKEVARLRKKLWGEKPPKGYKNPWKKGEALKDAKDNWYLGCDEKTVAITVSSDEKYPPGIVNRNRHPITSEKDFYSGCYCIVTLVPAALDITTNKCSPFYLQNIMKVQDGEHLGGRESAEKEFEEVNWDDVGDLDDYGDLEEVEDEDSNGDSRFSEEPEEGDFDDGYYDEFDDED